MIGLFLFGTLWFWLLLAAAVLTVGVFIARESFGKATISLILFFGLLALCGDFNVLSWIRDHAFQAALYGGIYFVAGTAWSVWKWWFFVKNLRRKYDDAKRSFLQSQNVDGDAVPERLKADWTSWYSQYASRDFGDSSYGQRRATDHFPPKARNFKAKIVSWMIYWPWSFIVTVIDDPIRKLFRAIYEAIQGMLQRISDKAFAGTENDFAASPPTTLSAPPAGGARTRGRARGNGASAPPGPSDDDETLTHIEIP